MTPSDAGGTAADGPRTWPVVRTASYGGVVVKAGPDSREVAMIRPASDADDEVWALPKGAADEGESPEDAARREVSEETGLSAEIVQALDPITYWFSWAPERVRYRKTVHFFLMRWVEGEPSPDGVEVAEVRFVPVDRAPRTATYRSEREVLRTVAGLVRTW